MNDLYYLCNISVFRVKYRASIGKWGDVKELRVHMGIPRRSKH